MVSQQIPKITEGLSKAIQGEADGYNFYMMAAKNTPDGKGQEIFISLAKDELEHLRFLKAQYQSFLAHGRPDSDLKLPPLSAVTKESGIFSDEIKSRLQEAHYEMSALSIGIQLELSAINFYQKEALEASDPIVRSFYQDLANWESKHYTLLLNQQQALKEDYWDGGGFSPF